MNDPAHVGQPNPGPLEFNGAVEPLEDSEELVRVAHIETHTVVPHKNNILGRARLTADLNPGRFPGASIFKRVADQVEHYLLQEGRVRFDPGQVPDDPFNSAV